MNWSQNAAFVLIIIAFIVAVASVAASIAVWVQIIRQGGWKLAEPSVIQGRWRMLRPWLLVGAGVGLLFSFVIFVLLGIDQTPPALANDVIISPPIEMKSRPRDGGQPTE